MRFPRFFYAADGVTSATSSEAALDATFGAMSTVRPDLAAAETRERERKASGKPSEAQLELGRPLLDSEKAADEEARAEEADKSKPAEAAPKEPPAEAEAESGSDPESATDEQAALDALVAKYEGKPKSLAKALREMRSLQTKTAEERKTLEDQFEEVMATLDRDYDVVDGKPVLKPEVAAKALRNGTARPKPFQVPSEDQVRVVVEKEFRDQANEMFEEDQIPAYIAKMKPMIDSVTKERFEAVKVKAADYRNNILADVGNIVEKHLRDHPDDASVMPLVDAFYGGIPEEVRLAAILDDWLPFGQVAELFRIKQALPDIVKKAYALGQKNKGSAEKLTESGAPGKSRPSPSGGRQASAGSVEAFKENIKRGSGLPAFDSIFQQ